MKKKAKKFSLLIQTVDSKRNIFLSFVNVGSNFYAENIFCLFRVTFSPPLLNLNALN